MSGYIIKLFVILFISVAGAGALAYGAYASKQWPIKFKAEPKDPTPTVIAPPLRPDELPSHEAGETETPSDETTSDDVATPAGEAASADATDEPGVPQGAIVLDTLKISLSTAAQLFEYQAAAFVDARPLARYTEGHVQGSVHITPDMLDDIDLFQVQVLDPERPIVVYCDGGDCDDSHLVVQQLQELHGLHRTHILTDGYPAWAAANLPIETGPDPLAE